MEIISQIAAAIPDWLEAIFMLVTAASAIAALTPTKKDDDFIAKTLLIIRKVANIFAINLGNAKPKADDEGK